jgi:FkbM family methyltransferase
LYGVRDSPLSRVYPALVWGPRFTVALVAHQQLVTMNAQVRLMDIGARGGIHPRWKPFYPLLEVRAFDADADECRRLNEGQYPYSGLYIPATLGAIDGEKRSLHITKAPGCSSLLLPDIELCSKFPFGGEMEVVSVQSVTLSRLDTVCPDFQPDFIKVDTQGTELEILHGAGQLLESAIGVELEVEFIQQYVGQPLFADVEAFMRSRGFSLRGLRRSFWRQHALHTHSFGGQLVHGDALYLRSERLNSPVGHIILAAYQQYDLLAAYGVTDLIPKQSRLLALARSLASRLDHRSLRGMLNQLRSRSATDWHDPDFF